MQHISQIQLPNTEIPCNNSTMNIGYSEPSKELIDQILSMFTEWKMWFGNKMKINDWQMDKALLWANYLTAKKITKREFAKAKAFSIDLDFPPNNPKEFLNLARDYGDMRQEYLNACNDKYTSAIAYEVTQRIGYYELHNHPEKVTYPLWQKYYAEVIKEIEQGKVFTLPKSNRIEQKPHQAVDTNTAKSFLDKLKVMRKQGVLA